MFEYFSLYFEAKVHCENYSLVLWSGCSSSLTWFSVSLFIFLRLGFKKRNFFNFFLYKINTSGALYWRNKLTIIEHTRALTILEQNNLVNRKTLNLRASEKTIDVFKEARPVYNIAVYRSVKVRERLQPVW